MQAATPCCRMGFGFDAHRLVPGRRLILGGVSIPFQVGLLGHSDADVLAHAVIDAVIGALGRGDIGRHFPDSDARFKDADSLALLAEVMRWVQAENLRIGHLDATIVAQQPRLAPFMEAMQANLARVMGIALPAVNLKAKTTEGMGFCGREEGMAAFAVVTLTTAQA